MKTILKLFLGSFLGLISISLQSQGSPVTIYEKFYGDTLKDMFVDVILADDGNLIVAGNDEVYPGNLDIVVKKFDLNGNPIWSHNYGGAFEERFPQAMKGLVKSHDGGYIASTHTNSYGVGIDSYVLKLDSNGYLIWSAIFGGSEMDDPRGLIETEDSSIVGIGLTSSDLNQTNVRTDNYWFKIDKNGNLIWQNHIGGSYWERCFSIVESDNYFIGIGQINWLGPPVAYFIDKVTGDTVGADSVILPYPTSFYSTEPTSDGNFILAGTSTISNSLRVATLLKMDEFANILWYQHYFSGPELDAATFATETMDGGYALCGWTVSEAVGSDDAFIIKTDSLGNEVWKKIYGGLGEESFDHLVEVEQNDFILCGHSESQLNDPKQGMLVRVKEVPEPGVIAGRVFQDTDSSCSWTSGDFQLPNRVIEAIDSTGGVYSGFSDGNGFYTLSLPVGEYSISLPIPSNEPRKISDCLQNSSYSIQVNPSDTINGLDFPLLLTGDSADFGNCQVSLSIGDYGYETGPCTSVLVSPCPGFGHRICYVIENEQTSTQPIYPGQFLNINNLNTPVSPFPFDSIDFSISTIDSLSGILSLNGGVFSIGDTLFPGDSVSVCLIGTPQSPLIPNLTPTYFFAGDLSINSPGINLVRNGNFEQGNIGFYSQYSFDSTLGMGTYVLAEDASSFNSCLIGKDFPSEEGIFLLVDGDSSKFAWCQTLDSLSIGQEYRILLYAINLSAVGCSSSMSSPTPELGLFVCSDSIDSLLCSISLPVDTNHSWRPLICSWEATVDSIDLCLKVLNASGPIGFDIGIDSIVFQTEECSGGLPLLHSISDPICSCDPNDLRVDPEGCGLNGNISFSERLEYTVRFENIGTGPAYNIVIIDTLSANLDISSLKFYDPLGIANFSILPHNILRIELNGINLPGAQFAPLNRGEVIFSLSPNLDLLEGTEISNSAAIYFDSNPPIITNKTVNTLYHNPIPNSDFIVQEGCIVDSSWAKFQASGKYLTTDQLTWNFGNGANISQQTVFNPDSVFFSGTHLTDVSLKVIRNGCLSETTKSIPVGSGPTFFIETLDPACNGSSFGEINLKNLDKQNPIFFKFNDSLYYVDESIYLDSLFSDNYTYWAGDSMGCFMSGNVNLNYTAPLIAQIVQFSPLGTSKGQNSFADLEVSGGTPPYEFLWSTGDTTEDIQGFNDREVFVEVWDNANCYTKTDASIYKKQGYPANSFLLFPNPTNGMLFLESESLSEIRSIEVFDIHGRKLLTFSHHSIGKSFVVDLESVSTGTYLVKVRTPDGLSYFSVRKN